MSEGVTRLPLALGTIALPDWLPAWVPVALLIPAVLWLLLLLATPFAVLGSRSRLEAIEAQLDDLHAELRLIALHLGPPSERSDERASQNLDGRPSGARPRQERAEPRVDWPGVAGD